MKLDRSNPQRHWFQFSIKAVMILTLAAASFAAGKLSEQRRARDAERRARDQARIVAEKSFGKRRTPFSNSLFNRPESLNQIRRSPECRRTKNPS